MDRRTSQISRVLAMMLWVTTALSAARLHDITCDED